ncbi:polysaccharide pyruvyl transferase family protein [Microbacterium sp. CH12i]|uniref:polysaccharide pyruvyl transferase family protein n=1 Tax=Microbacterium sp. CH12i TaxID=1479651 RepID=UPI0009DFA1E6|nr:polysaccharide pyruvyl transferase family protein [Microbacterium sp. CH12i]
MKMVFIPLTTMVVVTPGLFIGAYERDNFGDLLFLTQTRHFMRGVDASGSSLIDSDMTGVGGEHVSAYPSLLHGARVPFVWVVGGETGGTSVTDAVAMLDHDLRGRGADSGLGLPAYASPYLPRPSRYPALQGSASVINSVGVSGVRPLTGKHRIETIGALREATFLSVREAASSQVLTRLGIEHRLAPDLVHTVAKTTPLDAESDRTIALVQAKVKHIERVGIPEFAKLLAGSGSLRPFHIRLFSAGEAPGHDSLEVLKTVAHEFRAFGGGARIDVSEARTAHEKAAEIASAGLWIGTSLHGYIISTSYNVPRVGLMLRKVKQYASSWDIPAPSGVPLRSLDGAIEQALELSRTTDGDRLALHLADRAEENVRPRASMFSALKSSIDGPRQSRPPRS